MCFVFCALPPIYTLFHCADVLYIVRYSVDVHVLNDWSLDASCKANGNFLKIESG